MLLSAQVKIGVILDKKNTSNKDRITLVLTNCTNLASVIDAFSGSEVHIKLKSAGQLFYKRTISLCSE